jgi:hypothetical protein
MRPSTPRAAGPVFRYSSSHTRSHALLATVQGPGPTCGARAWGTDGEWLAVSSAVPLTMKMRPLSILRVDGPRRLRSVVRLAAQIKARFG